MNMQISYLSPPFGPAAFYLKSVAPPEISLQDIYRALWPFILMQITAIALVMIFPEIALWLPRTLMGGG
jgi:TRAP-type mannitol/chloroaromatic compound transport system permease large subunit